MKLIIVRHGETTHNRDGVSQGQADTMLTELGKKQAQCLAERLVNEKIDTIYSSDLKRCKDTLKPFLKLKKMKVNYTADLREINMGVFQEKPMTEYVEWKKSRKEKWDKIKPANGESFVDVRFRIKKIIDYILEEEKGKIVLIMTHGKAKRAILMNLLNRNDEAYHDELRELSKNTAVTILNIKDSGKHEVESLYSVDHLEDLDES